MSKQDKRQKRAKEKAKRARQIKQKQIEYRTTDLNTGFFNDETPISQPEQYFGYNRERRDEESLFDFPAEGMLCMVSIINEQNILPLIEETSINFELGQWFLSENLENHKHIVHGPFNEVESALDFGRVELGVISYRSAPLFDGLEPL